MSQFDKAFKKVLLLDNYGFDFDVAIDKKYNILWRQDGLGGSDSANWVPHDTIKNASHLIITEPWGGRHPYPLPHRCHVGPCQRDVFGL